MTSGDDIAAMMEDDPYASQEVSETVDILVYAEQISPFAVMNALKKNYEELTSKFGEREH